MLHSGYWIDEAITVGIASHGLGDIPGLLRLDGSPPLFYLLLHGWMAVAAQARRPRARCRSLFALLAVPVAWWAGDALFGRRAGALAAVGAAGCPFLTYYAQETRMYSLVCVLSVLACASFVLAFVHGRRRHLWLLGVWLVLLLYAHNWALFLVGGTGGGVAVAVAARAGSSPRRRAARRRRRGRLRAVGPEPDLPGRQHRGAVVLAPERCCTCSASPARCSATSPCRCWPRRRRRAAARPGARGRARCSR